MSKKNWLIALLLAWPLAALALQQASGAAQGRPTRSKFRCDR